MLRSPPAIRYFTLGKHYYKLLLGVYFAALAICLGTRIALKLRFMEISTGFYTQNNTIVLIFNTALFAGVLLLFIANRLRKVGNDYPVYHQSKPAGVLAMLVGASIVTFVLLDSPYAVIEQNHSALLLQIRDILSVGLGILAGISLVMIGFGGLIDYAGRAAMVPALFGSIWQVFMLVTRFNSYTTLTTISDNLLAVLFMIFASLFLMGHARTIFGFSRKDGRNYTLAAGLCTSLTGLVLVVPNYVFMAVNSVLMPAPMLGLWESVYVLLLSLYALVFVLSMMRSIKRV